MKRTLRGFTLIELMVVIAIIGLLATIITASLGSAKVKGRDARRIADIKSIQVALELYYNDNLMYPTNIYKTSGSAPNNGLAPSYISVVPVDPFAASGVTPTSCATTPTGSGCYSYEPLGYGSGVCNAGNPPVKYHLGVALEQTGNNSALTQDVDAPLAGSGVMTGFVSCTAFPNDFDGGSANGPIAPARCGSAGAGVESCYDVTN